ncbi:MAG: serine hydrolase [Bacteroidota bacterium]
MPSTKTETASVEQPSHNFEPFEEKVRQWQRALNIPYAGVGIIAAGEVQYTGVISASDSIPRQDMLFNLASVTKVIFGTTVMKLVENGQWDLDAPLHPYHIDEDVKNDPRHLQITARDVLSQRSGFVNWRWNHPTAKLTFDFDPGTTWNYSGEGMEYLRLAIEKKFETGIQAIADSLLFQPSGMKDTNHAWDGKTQFERFSGFYDTEGKLHELEDHSFSAQAADDIMCTITDLANFGQYVVHGGGLSEKTFQTMVTAQTPINDNQDQALAWRFIQDLPNGEYAIHHGGNDIGVATLVVLLPKSKRGIVVATNGDGGLVLCNNVVRELWPEGPEIIHRAYRAGSLEDVPKVITITPEVLEEYVGVYEQPSGRQVTIAQSENGLLMKMPGVPNFQLFPEKETLFFLKDFDPKIEFLKTEPEDNFSLKIIEGENTILCKKIQ